MISQTSNLFLELQSLDWDKVLPFQYGVIHHSLTKDGATVSARAIEKYHMEPKPDGMGMSEIGYHFLVEQAPEDDTPDAMTIWVGRSLYKAGGHAKGFNAQSFGICCVGNYDIAPPSGRHWETMLWVSQLTSKFFRERKNIDLKFIGHFETFGLLNKPVEKSCPGTKWDMDKFRKQVKGG